MKYNENGKRRVYNIDLDGVLTNGESFWEKEPTPNYRAINTLRYLYCQGNLIIIWTARAWEFAPETAGWLVKNRIPFHGLYMSKGGSDYYIDDKNIGVEEFYSMKAGDISMDIGTNPVPIKNSDSPG